MASEPAAWLTAKEVAANVRCNVGTVWRWCRENRVWVERLAGGERVLIAVDARGFPLSPPPSK